MAVYLVVLLSVLTSIGLRGSKVAVSLYALELGAGAAPVFFATGVFLLAAGFLSVRGSSSRLARIQEPRS